LIRRGRPRSCRRNPPALSGRSRSPREVGRVRRVHSASPKLTRRRKILCGILCVRGYIQTAVCKWKTPRVLTLEGFMSARATGLEPATTGSTVPLRHTPHRRKTSTLRPPTLARVVPGVVTRSHRALPTPNSPHSLWRGRHYPNTSVPQSKHSSAPPRLLPDGF
jgi:hypothetical protein